MNVVSRGIKNALRSPIRSGAIILMLAISIGLILSMLVARGSVTAKINDVKATTATAITINPAGVQGFAGGGNPLTTAQVATITSTAHIKTIAATLTDQMGTSDTNLIASLELGSFGQRQMRFESSGSTTSSTSSATTPSDSTSSTETARPIPTPRTSVTGTTNPSSTIASDKITSGTTIDGAGNDFVALIGTSLATKNNLKVGDTFTAYSKTITVKGIFDTGNTFQNSGIVMPIATVQELTGQTGAVSSVLATVDSSDNVSSTVTALKTALGSAADITSEQEQAASSLAPLQSISDLALAGVIGAAIAGSVIVLLSMIMIVRERRREIGVIKAIGGTNSKVITQFIIEGLTLTVFGAIVGLALGVLVSGPMTSSLVQNSTSSSSTATPSQGSFRRAFGGGISQINTNINQVTASITPQIFVSAIGITLLIAIIGSAVPAWFIARVRPAEVLRTE